MESPATPPCSSQGPAEAASTVTVYKDGTRSAAADSEPGPGASTTRGRPCCRYVRLQGPGHRPGREHQRRLGRLHRRRRSSAPQPLPSRRSRPIPGASASDGVTSDAALILSGRRSGQHGHGLEEWHRASDRHRPADRGLDFDYTGTTLSAGSVRFQGSGHRPGRERQPRLGRLRRRS